ncbi:MAG: 30S ribosome-binding factor RbfA [bacterium]
MALHSRILRVQDLLKAELSQILLYEMKDPRLGFLTISEVKVSKDLRYARVYVSLLEEDEEKIRETFVALEKARGFIKKQLAERVSLKFLPDLSFEFDTSARYAFEIETIFQKLKKEESSKPKASEEEDKS